MKFEVKFDWSEDSQRTSSEFISKKLIFLILTLN